MKTADRIARELGSEVEIALHRLGLMCRVFARAKSKESIALKMQAKRYTATRGMQDLIGIRIALYFADDIDLAKALIRRRMPGRFLEQTVDDHDPQTFGPARTNLIFRLSEAHSAELGKILEDPRIENTFELQLRTVLSEGWHEVEHDLRYKCQEDWTHNEDLTRALNGIMASLETSDWSMLRLFDELAHRHYRARRWAAMMRARFRLRLQRSPIDASTFECLDSDAMLAKTVFRFGRQELLSRVSETGLDLPITYSNLVFIICWLSGMQGAVKTVLPDVVKSQLEETFI